MRADVPLPVKRSLIKLGGDMRTARLRRRISTTIMAERVAITRTTLRKMECGDPGVSFGVYATALFVLGFVSRIADLVDIRSDDVGLQLTDERLPQRIRSAQKTRKLLHHVDVLGER